jgi:acetylornithine/succinyldiaminopimelate/putrescine aminotransferase
MIGVELARDGKDVVVDMMHRGVLANCTSGNVIRFVPPLNIPEKDLERVTTVFLEALDSSEAQGSG